MRTTHRPSTAPGFTLFQLLVTGALTLAIGTGVFMMWKGARDERTIHAEQTHLAAVSRQAFRVFWADGTFAGLNSKSAIERKVAPYSMIRGGHLQSTWGENVAIDAANIAGTPNAGVRVEYERVPSRICIGLANATTETVWDIEINGKSVIDRNGRNIQIRKDELVSNCASARDGSNMVFTFASSASPMSAGVLPHAGGAVAHNPGTDTAPPSQSIKGQEGVSEKYPIDVTAVTPPPSSPVAILPPEAVKAHTYNPNTTLEDAPFETGIKTAGNPGYENMNGGLDGGLCFHHENAPVAVDVFIYPDGTWVAYAGAQGGKGMYAYARTGAGTWGQGISNPADFSVRFSNAGGVPPGMETSDVSGRWTPDRNAGGVLGSQPIALKWLDGRGPDGHNIRGAIEIVNRKTGQVVSRMPMDVQLAAGVECR